MEWNPRTPRWSRPRRSVTSRADVTALFTPAKILVSAFRFHFSIIVSKYSRTFCPFIQSRDKELLLGFTSFIYNCCFHCFTTFFSGSYNCLASWDNVWKVDLLLLFLIIPPSTIDVRSTTFGVTFEYCRKHH